jgi:hypothetical protein
VLRLTRLALLGQGLYYVATGAWPLVSLRTFEAISGPKTDDWLVHTVGALALVIGCALLAGLHRREPSRETLVLSGAAAIAFGAIDVIYVANGTIRPIYLADALVEALILVVLVFSRFPRRRAAR